MQGWANRIERTNEQEWTQIKVGTKSIISYRLSFVYWSHIDLFKLIWETIDRPAGVLIELSQCWFKTLLLISWSQFQKKKDCRKLIMLTIKLEKTISISLPFDFILFVLPKIKVRLAQKWRHFGIQKAWKSVRRFDQCIRNWLHSRRRHTEYDAVCSMDFGKKQDRHCFFFG